MVMSMKREQVQTDRLALAHMLMDNPKNIGFSGKDSSMLMTGNGGKLELKATLRNNLLPDKRNGDGEGEQLSIAIDAPNFQDWRFESGYHRGFMEANLDAALLAWCDPESLIVPISYTQNVWLDVALDDNWSPDPKINRKTHQENRLDTNVRDIQFCSAKMLLEAEYGEMVDMTSVGSLEFPFSIMMIREVIMSYWQAHLGDSSQFFQHCYSCNLHVEDVMPFERRWAISLKGSCTECASLESELQLAVPKF